MSKRRKTAFAEGLLSFNEAKPDFGNFFLSIDSPPQLVAKEKERTAKLDGHFFLSVAMLMQHSARVQLG